MPHEILETMRALREDMRQRMLQVPEYRALVALDRSIDELCAIMQDSMVTQQLQAPQPAIAERAPMPERAPVASPMPAPMQMAESPQQRASGIASAFAETLAAKIDQRNLTRASAPYLPNHRALGN